MDKQTSEIVVAGLIFLAFGVAILYAVGTFSLELLGTYLGFGLIVAGVLDFARLLIKNGHNRRR